MSPKSGSVARVSGSGHYTRRCQKSSLASLASDFPPRGPSECVRDEQLLVLMETSRPWEMPAGEKGRHPRLHRRVSLREKVDVSFAVDGPVFTWLSDISLRIRDVADQLCNVV